MCILIFVMTKFKERHLSIIFSSAFILIILQQLYGAKRSAFMIPRMSIIRTLPRIHTIYLSIRIFNNGLNYSCICHIEHNNNPCAVCCFAVVILHLFATIRHQAPWSERKSIYFRGMYCKEDARWIFSRFIRFSEFPISVYYTQKLQVENLYYVWNLFYQRSWFRKLFVNYITINMYIYSPFSFFEYIL